MEGGDPTFSASFASSSHCSFCRHGLSKSSASQRGGPALSGFYHFGGDYRNAGQSAASGRPVHRLVAFIMSGAMAFAYFMAHVPKSFYPPRQWRLFGCSLLLRFLYLVFAGGGGPWSIDRAVLKQD